MRRRLIALPFLLSLLVVAPSVARADAPAQVGFASSSLTPGGLAWGTAIADVTSDGRADLLVTTHGPASDASIDRDLLVFAQQPDGSLAAAPAVYAVPEATSADSLLVVAVGEFNGDGASDVVVGHGSGVDVFTQSGGTLQPPTATGTSGPVEDLHVADLNGDGLDDLVLSIALAGGTYRYTYRLQAADHTLGDGVAIGQGDAPSLAVGDVNGDAAPDVIVEDRSAANVRIFLGDGAAGPAFTESDDARTGHVVSAAVADVDGDARNDLVLLTTSGIQVLAGNADGSLAAPGAAMGVLDDAITLRAVDMNGDAAKDVVVSAAGGTQVFLQGGATLTAPCPFPSTTPSPAGGDPTVAIGDVNGDGRPDVAGAQESDRVRLLTQAAPGTASPSSVTARAVPNAIELDAGVTVSGELTLGSGGCLGVSTVQVWRSDAAGTLRVGDAPLSLVAQGLTYAFSFDDVPPLAGTVTYSVVFAGDAWHQRASSSGAAVAVGYKTPAFALTSKDAAVAAGGTTTLIANLTGPKSGSVVEFFSVAAGVRTSVGEAATNTNDNARLEVQIQQETRFVATFAGDDMWMPAETAVVTVGVVGEATSLSLKASSGVVSFGRETTLTASLNGGSGPRRIHFSRISDGTRKLLGTVKANARGVATLRVAPAANAKYVATYDGNAAWAPSTSAKVMVKVRVAVTARTTDYAYRDGAVAVYDCCRGYLFIKVAPVHGGKTVNVHVEYSTPSGWKALGTQSFVLKKDGTTKIFLDIEGGGGYRFRAQACFPSDGDHVGACGRWIGFRFQ